MKKRGQTPIFQPACSSHWRYRCASSSCSERWRRPSSERASGSAYASGCESREALEDALTEYSGTVLLVTHDRALIEALATRTIAIEDGRLRLREGAFGEYARDHEPAVDRPKAPAKPKPKPKAPPARPSQRQAREATRLEGPIRQTT